MKTATVMIAVVVGTCLAVLAAACGGGEEVSLDDFASSARPVCSEFADDVSLNLWDPAPYEDAASALAQLALPSSAAERKRAQALIEALDEAAVATREFSNAIDEYVKPGWSWVLTEDGNLSQYEESILGVESVPGFPAEIGRNYLQASDTLRQTAADAGLEACAPPEPE